MPLAYLTAYLTVFMRFLALICCAILLSACGTSYKVAPTNRKVDQHVAKVSESVSKATVSAKANRERAKAITESLKAGHTATKGVITAIDAAIRSLDLKDYPAVGRSLIEAKMGATFLLTDNTRLQGEVLRLSGENDTILVELLEAYKSAGKATEESAKFQKQVDELSKSQAKNQAIVDRVNWGFGLGAFIYGAQRILTFGFFGVLGLIVIIIVMLAIGGPAAIYALRFVRWLWGLIRPKKPG